MSFWWEQTAEESLLEWQWYEEKRRTGVAPPPTEFQRRQRVGYLKDRLRWARRPIPPPLPADDDLPLSRLLADPYRRLVETGFHIE